MKRNKRVRANADKLESMEGIMTNLYRVFNKYEKQSAEIKRLQERLSEYEKESVGVGDPREQAQSATAEVFIRDGETLPFSNAFQSDEEDEKLLSQNMSRASVTPPKMAVFSQLAQDIEKELRDFEETTLDHESMDKAFNELNEFKDSLDA